MSARNLAKSLLIGGVIAGIAPPMILLAATSSPSPGGGVLEEVVVTAQKREEKLQNVPIAITAMSGAELEKKGVTSFDGVAQSTPSITFAPYSNSSNTLFLYMRGQGLDDPGQLTRDGAVGLYVDGFYIARPQATTFDLADIERVEVLRGPQGTLYGRNTTGGAVNLISRQPTGEFGFKVSQDFGNRNMLRTFAVVDLPQWNDVSAKVTLLRSGIDGFVKNLGASHDFGEQKQRAGRLQLHWDATSAIRADYFIEKGDLDSTPVYNQSANFNGIDICGCGTPYHSNPNGPDRTTYRAFDLKLSTSTSTGQGLTLSWDLGDALTLKSLTGYRKLDFEAFQDYADTFGIPANQDSVYHQHQFSQEIQFVGSLADNTIRYVAGLYYFDERGWHHNTFSLYSVPASFDALVNAESKSKAVYAQLGWRPEILDRRLELIVGARYTKDDKSAERFGTADFSGIVEDGAATGSSSQLSYNKFNPALTLNYQWTDEVSTYAKVSTGYKAGGTLETAPAGAFGTNIFRPETLTNYEVGLKSYWWDHRVRGNLAIFDSRYKDIQYILPTSLSPGVLVAQAYNLGKATIDGVELELEVAPTEDLSFSFSGTYLHWKVNQVDVLPGTVFDPATGSGSPYRIGDNIANVISLEYAPKYNLNVGADYTFLHLPVGDLSAHVDWIYKGAEGFSNPTDGPAVPGRGFDATPPYGLLNGRLTMEVSLPHGDTARISLWGKNILDRKYIVNRGGVRADGSPGGVSAFNNGAPAGYDFGIGPWAEPPSYGVQFQYQYR